MWHTPLRQQRAPRRTSPRRLQGQGNGTAISAVRALEHSVKVRERRRAKGSRLCRAHGVRHPLLCPFFFPLRNLLNLVKQLRNCPWNGRFGACDREEKLTLKHAQNVRFATTPLKSPYLCGFPKRKMCKFQTHGDAVCTNIGSLQFPAGCATSYAKKAAKKGCP